MRPMCISAPPVGFVLVLAAIPALIILIVLSIFSRRAARVFAELSGVKE